MDASLRIFCRPIFFDKHYLNQELISYLFTYFTRFRVLYVSIGTYK